MRRFLPFDWGVPSGRWLNIMMNRIDPDVFAACFMDWVRACWPDPLERIAIAGKTVRRSHDRAKGRAATGRRLLASLRVECESAPLAR